MKNVFSFRVSHGMKQLDEKNEVGAVSLDVGTDSDSVLDFEIFIKFLGVVVSVVKLIKLISKNLVSINNLNS